MGAGLRLTLRWTLRTPHVRSAAGSRVARRPLPVAASMAMPSGQAQRYTQPGGRSGSTARTQARVAPCSKAEWTAPGLFQNRCLVQHTRLCFANQPPTGFRPISHSRRIEVVFPNKLCVAGARFLRLGPRQATLWHGRRHKPSYPRRVPGVAPRAARAGRAPPARTRPAMLVRVDFNVPQVPPALPPPRSSGAQPQRRRFAADWRRGHPGQAHWRHHRHNSPRGAPTWTWHTHRSSRGP